MECGRPDGHNEPRSRPCEIGRMPADAVALCKAEGWRWGGNYHGRKDWMHFEAVR